MPADFHPCPCCGARTVAKKFVYDICPVCGWEDDPDQSDLSSNHMSLEDARRRFGERSACKAHWEGHVVTEGQWELAVDLGLVYVGPHDGERHYRADDWEQRVRAMIPPHTWEGDRGDA